MIPELQKFTKKIPLHTNIQGRSSLLAICLRLYQAKLCVPRCAIWNFSGPKNSKTKKLLH
ncbi:hypothetical protein NBRC111894_1622 [Sporolactobacillus inulinus]|uniref:Uncharacterized protein n=1 Tax=Sporolactobacillus inulinus TaxID=2078 RepID=A0A4Y1ZBF1_9BACL|nr:hypothetical protein NBRC111894_1622 [Sporolactobacillus inulinus]